jgi:cytochrome bd-type quinol oxidase subunit 2
MPSRANLSEPDAMTASVPERRTPAAPADPLPLLRSRGYVRLLVLAVVLGAPISVAAYVLLQLVQQWVFTDLRNGLGFDAEPVGWPFLPLTLTGLLVGRTILVPARPRWRVTRRGPLPEEHDGLWALTASTAAMAAAVPSPVVDLYRRVTVSSTSSAFDLTVHNPAAGTQSRNVMTVVAVLRLPVVLGYEAWTCHIFPQRVRTEDFQAPPTVPPPRQSPSGGAAQAVPPRPSSPPGGLP